MTPERKEEIRKMLENETRICSVCSESNPHYRSGIAAYDHDLVRPILIEDELLAALDEAESTLQMIIDYQD